MLLFVVLDIVSMTLRPRDVTSQEVMGGGQGQRALWGDMCLWVKPWDGFGDYSLGDQLRCQDTFRESGRAFSVMPGPEEPAQAAHVSATRPRHWAAHTFGC